jgi:predicted DCC family thiol-disulfide oxidoreductase YuxK
MDSVIYFKYGKILTESSAVLGILSDLGGIWTLISILRLIPPFIRNAMYRFCARRRYHVFGMLETCMVPSSDWKNRFLP